MRPCAFVLCILCLFLSLVQHYRDLDERATWYALLVLVVGEAVWLATFSPQHGNLIVFDPALSLSLVFRLLLL